MKDEYSVLSVCRLHDDSLLCGITRKSNVLKPRMVIARWDHQQWHWIDTLPNCRYGDWNIWNDGSFWIGTQKDGGKSYHEASRFRGYQLSGEIVGEWIGKYSLAALVGDQNRWARFDCDYPYSPQFKKTLHPAIRLFEARGDRYVERRWPAKWGCLSVAVTPENEVWCFGAPFKVTSRRFSLLGPNHDRIEIMLPDGKRVPAPSVAACFGSRSALAFAKTGWFYMMGNGAYAIFYAKTADVLAGKWKWRYFFDLSEVSANDEIGKRFESFLALEDGSVIASSSDGYVRVLRDTFVGDDNYLENPLTYFGQITHALNFAVVNDRVFQGTINHGVQVFPLSELRKPKPKMQELPRIPADWFTRVPKRVPKTLQRHLTFETVHDEPPTA